MACSIERVEPPPISIMAMTAATPMMIPRQVSEERRTFRRKARKAMRRVRRRVLIRLGALRLATDHLREKRVFDVRRGGEGFAGDDFVPLAQSVGAHDGICAVGDSGGDLDGADVRAIFEPEGPRGSFLADGFWG